MNSQEWGIGKKAVGIKTWKTETDGQLVTNLADLKNLQPKLAMGKAENHMISKTPSNSAQKGTYLSSAPIPQKVWACINNGNTVIIRIYLM